MIPFSPPHIDEDIIQEVVAALRSGWITTGPRTKQFEKMLTGFNRNKSTLCVNSATAGLELVLRWFGVGVGDEVIIPAYTYCATANVVLHCGAVPVMVDIVPETFNIDTKQIVAKITERTKVIIPVDIGGYPADYDEINAIVSSAEVMKLFKPQNSVQEKLQRILVMADAAHSLGALYKSRPTGTMCDITVFSFHAVKNLTTAEGGAIAFNLPEPFDCEEVYRYFNILSLHGQSKDALAKMQGKASWRYDVLMPGYKCNMTDIQAAIGIVELSRYRDKILERRKAIFEFYFNAFKEFTWAMLPVFDDGSSKSSYHVFLLRIAGFEETQRDRMIEEIFNRDVAVNVHFQPLPLLSVYKKLGYAMSNFPNAYSNYKCEISLPVYYDLTHEMCQTVVTAVIEAYMSVSCNK
ncbi:MAG TPA: DegT/DnrJ/EryC1/StrS aminotransferase family protein [Bacteroidales bacterium]|nr:DegT/DnrJ/EryC1/StrS aminotransferase family protein [Bacteroidales bacterium]HQP03616.1 DegT/DnrJ/EryC1/StrS aminotransferase family protein [Bacteroidales bacterium]